METGESTQTSRPGTNNLRAHLEGDVARAKAGSTKGTQRRIVGRAGPRSHAQPFWQSPQLALAAALIAVLVAIAWLAYAAWEPRSSTSGEWGPLAVSQLSLGGDTALTEGTLRISDACVLLEGADGSGTLLVWPREQTTWDPSARLIRFQNRDGRVIDLGDGQRVRFGGSGVSFGDAPSGDITTWDAWVNRIAWEAEPDPACSADSSWSVGQATVGP